MDIRFKVTPEILVKQSSASTSAISNMQASLNEMTALINHTESYWQSVGANLNRSSYKKLEEEFQEIINTMKDHSERLILISQNYTAGEQKAIDTAEPLESDVIS